MKFEKINHNRLKVTLSDQDLNEWGINFDNLSYNTPKVQELFMTMIKRAEKELGFYTDNSQLVIEAVPTTHNDGFTMFITKVETDEDATITVSRYLKGKFKKSDLKPIPLPKRKKPENQNQAGTMVYSFTEFDAICSCAKYLSYEHIKNSTIYKYDNNLYLMLMFEAPKYAFAAHRVISEFGTRHAYPRIIAGLIAEHGELFISDAVNVLKTHFK